MFELVSEYFSVVYPADAKSNASCKTDRMRPVRRLVLLTGSENESIALPFGSALIRRAIHLKV